MSEKPCVILNEPQLAENISSVARVMANFGLEDLRMVRPRDGWPQERAWVEPPARTGRWRARGCSTGSRMLSPTCTGSTPQPRAHARWCCR